MDLNTQIIAVFCRRGDTLKRLFRDNGSTGLYWNS